MVVYFTDGFETFPVGWTTNTGGTGTITKSNTHVHGGSWACKVYDPDNASHAWAYRAMTEATGDYHIRFYIYPSAAITYDNAAVMQTRDVGAAASVYIKMDDVAGTIYLQSEDAGGLENIAVLVTGQYYKVDCYVDVSAREMDVYIDNVFAATVDIYTGEASDPDRVYVGTLGVAQDGEYWLDDVLIDDDMDGVPGSEDLLGIFNVRRETSVDLLGIFDVRQEASEDLAAEFEVGGQGSVELLCLFDVRQETSVNLLGLFEGQTSVDLLGEFIVRQETSVDLAAEFEVSGIIDASVELLGIFNVRQSVSVELKGQFIVIHRYDENLKGEFIVQQEASQELLGLFDIQRDATVDLLGEFVVRHSATLNLLGELVVRHESSEELLGKFVVTQPASVDLLGEFTVRQEDTADLAAGFDGQTSVDLSCVFNVSQARGTADLPASVWINYYILNLPAKFYVRQTSLRATDFRVIDNTRGLTIEDAAREMTVTPRRRMRVK